MKPIDARQLLREWGADYFHALSTFGALSYDTIHHLLASGRVFELKQGELLYRPGDKVKGFYVVLKGSVAVYMHYRNHSGQCDRRSERPGPDRAAVRDGMTRRCRLSWETGSGSGRDQVDVTK